MVPNTIIKPAKAATDPPPSGTWTIESTETETKADTTIVLNGSLRILGELTLDNVTLIMKSPSGSAYNITVYDGGVLTVKGNSTIIAEDPANPWFFAANTGSAIELRNSTFSYAGCNSTAQGRYSGLWINTDEAQLLNCTINSNFFGIYLYKAESCLIANNSVTASLNTAIFVWECANATLSGNTLIENGWSAPEQVLAHAIRLDNSENCTIVANTLENNNGSGICLYSGSPNSTLKNNRITNSSFSAITLSRNNHSVISGNIVLNGLDAGILLYRSNQTRISDNNVTNTRDGIYLENSQDAVISDNKITHAANHGIRTYKTGNCVIDGCSITNAKDGIALGYHSHNITVTDNIVTNSSRNGIVLYEMDIATVINNTITRSGSNGINLSVGTKHINGISNTVTDCSDYGIYMPHCARPAESCLFYGNFLANNQVGNAYDETLLNQWDNGTHGNWWDDYFGPDLNYDGIGDSPYRIPGNGGAEDRYPLVNLTDILLDSTAPIIIDPPVDKTFEEGTTGVNIIWNATDAHPAWYNITYNGTLVQEGAWERPIVQISLDALEGSFPGILAYGVHSFTLIVYDGASNWASDTVLITFVDTTPPQFTFVTNDFRFEKGDSTRVVRWTVSGLDSQSFWIIYQDAVMIANSSMNASMGISAEYLAKLPLGTFNFTIVVIDKAGNKISHTIIVEVVRPEQDEDSISSIIPGFTIWLLPGLAGWILATRIKTKGRKEEKQRT